jgi:hypothetical protein
VASPYRIGLGEASGAIADLGVLVPLAAALILVNGLDPGAVLLGAGLLVVSAGLFFRIPFPVQPLKALTAVAVAGLALHDMIKAVDPAAVLDSVRLVRKEGGKSGTWLRPEDR